MTRPDTCPQCGADMNLLDGMWVCDECGYEEEDYFEDDPEEEYPPDDH